MVHIADVAISQLRRHAAASPLVITGPDLASIPDAGLAIADYRKAGGRIVSRGW